MLPLVGDNDRVLVDDLIVNLVQLKLTLLRSGSICNFC